MGLNIMITCGRARQRSRIKHPASFQLEPVEPRLLLATFTVTNIADSGAGTLRQAITDANGSPGFDSIAFNIAGAIPTINLSSALPAVTDPLIITGATQPGGHSVDISGRRGACA